MKNTLLVLFFFVAIVNGNAQTLSNTKAYPNPTSDVVNIHTEEKTTFTVYNIAGQKLKETAVTEDDYTNKSCCYAIEISLGDLPAGKYIIQGVSNSSTLYKPMVVQKM